MPIAPSYPGVYIEEIPSGVRTITGVATSVTAFIGRAERGPVNEPTTITSFGDYERTFGGLSLLSTMSYAVRDFYQNGGSQAIVVRVIRNGSTARFNLPVEAGSPPATSPPSGNLTLDAASAGAWGRNLSVIVDYNTADPTAPVTSPPAAPDPELVQSHRSRNDRHYGPAGRKISARFDGSFLASFRATRAGQEFAPCESSQGQRSFPVPG
jgi:phage tail sheath protein FI